MWEVIIHQSTFESDRLVAGSLESALDFIKHNTNEMTVGVEMNRLKGKKPQ